MNAEGITEGEKVKMEEGKEEVVFMWGYLPGALPQRSPLLSPTVVRTADAEYAWKDVCGGGCGFAMAISGAFFELCLGFLLSDCSFTRCLDAEKMWENKA